MHPAPYSIEQDCSHASLFAAPNEFLHHSPRHVYLNHGTWKPKPMQLQPMLTHSDPIATIFLSMPRYHYHPLMHDQQRVWGPAKLNLRLGPQGLSNALSAPYPGVLT